MKTKQTKELNAPGKWMLLYGYNHRIIGKKTACGITAPEGEAKPVITRKYRNSMPRPVGNNCESCQDKIVEFHCRQANKTSTSGSKRHVS